MRSYARPVAVSPLGFGRRRRSMTAVPARPLFSDDARLFLWTFAAGFLSVSIFLA